MNLLELLVSVRIDTSSINKKLNDLRQAGQKVESSLNSNFKKIANGFKLMAGAFVATVILKALNAIIQKTVELGKEMIKLSSDAKEMNDKFDVVFKGIEKETRKWADDFAYAIGRNKNEIRGFLADNQDLLTGFGATSEKGAELSKAIISLGIDLASFQNKADTDVLENLTSGLLGNHMAVKSLGIAFTEAELKITMYQKGLKGTFDSLTAIEKMEVRLATAYRQSKNALGDAVRTQGNYANQSKRLEGNIKELKTTIGDIFLPILTKAVTYLNIFFDSMKKNSDGIKSKVVNAFNLILDVLAGLIKALAYSLRFIASFFESNKTWINAFYNVFKKAFLFVKNLVETTFKALKESWDKYGPEISKNIKIILKEVAKMFDRNIKKVNKLWKENKDKVKDVVDFIVEHISTNFKIIAEILKGINNLLDGDTPAALENFKKAWSTWAGQTEKDADRVRNIWSKILKTDDANIIKDFFKTIIDGWSKDFTRLKNFLEELKMSMQLIPATLGVLKDELFQLGKDIIDRFVKGMKKGFKNIGDTVTDIKDTVTNTVKEKANSFLDIGKNITTSIKGSINSGLNTIKAPFKKFGEFVSDGLIEGINSKDKELEKATKEGIVDPIINTTKEELEIHSPSEVFKDIANWIIKGLTSIFGSDKSVSKASADLAKDTKKSYEENIKGIGENTTKEIVSNVNYEEIKNSGKKAAEKYGAGLATLAATGGIGGILIGGLGVAVEKSGKDFSTFIADKLNEAADYLDKGADTIQGLRIYDESLRIYDEKDKEKDLNNIKDTANKTKSIFQKVSDFFKEIFSGITEFFKGSFLGKIGSSIASLFSFSSSSKKVSKNSIQDSSSENSSVTEDKSSKNSIASATGEFFSDVLQKFAGDNALSGAISSLFSGDIKGVFLGIFEGMAGESEVFKEMMKELNQTIGAIVQNLLPVFNSLFNSMRPLIPILSEIMYILGNFLGEVFQQLLPLVIPILKALIPVLQLFLGVLQPVIAIFTKVVNPALLAVAKVIANIANAFIGIYNAIAKALKKLGIKVKTIDKIRLDTSTSSVVSSSSSSSASVSGGSSGLSSSSSYSSGGVDLTRLLAPLANFNNLVAVAQNIYNLLEQNFSKFTIPTLDYSLVSSDISSNYNTSNSNSVIIENINITSYSNNKIDLTKDLVDTLETELASRQFWNRKRGK